MAEVLHPPRALARAHRIAVMATDDRSALHAGYYVVVLPETAQRLGVGRWAALAHEHPALLPIGDVRKKRDYIAIHCCVHVTEDTRLRDMMTAGRESILVDQTLRNALGIPFAIFPHVQETIGLYLFPAERSRRDAVTRRIGAFFGIRSVAVRSTPAAVVDIEKGYVRVPEDVLNVIGAQAADDVVVERPIALPGDEITRFRIIAESMSTAAATSAIIEKREKLLADVTHRYPDSKKILYDFGKFVEVGILDSGVAAGLAARQETESDIPPIFMDLDARRQGTSGFPDQPEADYLTPFMVRRSVLSAAIRDSLSTALAFTLTLIQFSFFFSDRTRIDAWQWAAGVFIALLISATLLRARLRQQI